MGFVCLFTRDCSADDHNKMENVHIPLGIALDSCSYIVWSLVKSVGYKSNGTACQKFLCECLWLSLVYITYKGQISVIEADS